MSRFLRAAGLGLLLGSVLTGYPVAGADGRLSQGGDIETGEVSLVLAPVPSPDLSGTEADVRQALSDQRDVVNRLLNSPEPSRDELALAFGRLGALYQAHNIYAPAQPSYLNAETLDPESFRWPYLLGYLGQQTGQPELARDALRRCLIHSPENQPARLRLAQTLVEMNDFDQARRLLETPFQDPGMKAAVLFERGKIAMGEHDYEGAAALFESALEAQPLANRIHYPLALAYRSLGDVGRARSHFAQYGNGKPDFPDPEVEQLDQLMRGGHTQLNRGVVAVQKGNYEVAVAAFAEALEREPDNVNLRVSLARSLYLAGDRGTAEAQLAEALRRDPDHVLASFITGVLLQSQGEDERAMARYQTVLTRQPDHAGAHHFAGHLLMKQGRYQEAAGHYAKALRGSSRDYPALFMEAMALYGSGAPHTRIRPLLERGVAEQPGKWMFNYALARLLAASPEDSVRDGPRALTIARALYEQFPGFQNAEALAMALAETGDMEQAVDLMHYAIANAHVMGAPDRAEAMQDTLDRFRQGRPSRRPFYDDTAFFQPPPFDPTNPIRDYPTGEPY